MDYAEMLARLTVDPGTHVAVIWGIYVVGYLRYLGKRIGRVERSLNLPEVKPFRPSSFRKRG